MEDKVLRELPPLLDSDFMYVADRRKKEFTYPIHKHEVFELNYVENGDGVLRIVGDSAETIGNRELVLITSPDLEHVWEQDKCKKRGHTRDNRAVLLRLQQFLQPLQPHPPASYQASVREGTQGRGVHTRDY